VRRQPGHLYLTRVLCALKKFGHTNATCNTQSLGADAQLSIVNTRLMHCVCCYADFVRLAARCGAVIVPFAAVGADDAYDVFMDVDEVLEAPVLGDLVRVSTAHTHWFLGNLWLLSALLCAVWANCCCC
jgi:hypothetical protein